jgi:transposase
MIVWTGSRRAAATAVMTWAVQCGCGKVHTAQRPDGARCGPVGYGPSLAAFAVYLMVVHFIPAHRVVELLESLTGTAPSVGFVHGMINRAAGLLTGVDQRIRALITLAYAVCCDETPLRVGPSSHQRGRRRPSGTCWWPPPSSTPTT